MLRIVNQSKRTDATGFKTQITHHPFGRSERQFPGCFLPLRHQHLLQPMLDVMNRQIVVAWETDQVMLISLVVSMLVGCVFNMKKICDRILGGWFHLNTFETNKKILFYLFEAVIGSVIFTPFNMFFNQMYGMYMGIKMSTGFPPFVKNLFDGIQFLFTQAHFLDAYLGGLLPSILIGIPISLVGTLMFGKITDKICGIDG